MRNKNPLVIIIPAIILLLGGGLYLVRITYFPKYQWSQRYSTNKNQPYDISVFYKLLEGAVDEDHFSKLRFNPYSYKRSEDPSLFVAVNNYALNDSVSFAKMLEGIRQGDELLFIHSFPESIINQLVETDSIFNNLSDHQFTQEVLASINTVPDTTRFYLQVAKKLQPAHVAFFNDSILNTLNTRDSTGNLLPFNYNAIGYLNDTLLNVIQVPIGKGQVIFHINPLCFTNYHMNRDSVLNYVNGVMASCHSNQIVWLEDPISFSGGTGAGLSRGPLHYIISQPAFRNAWYMTLLLVILAIAFGAKRKQKIIPIVPKLKNGAVEYATTVSTFYFQSKNHSYIAREMMQLFWTDIKERYGISKASDRGLVVKPLSEVTGIPENHFVQLFRAEAAVTYSSQQDNEYILKLYQHLEHYYQNRK